MSPPPVGPTTPPSFTGVLCGDSPPLFRPKTPSRFKSRPSIQFSDEEVDTLIAPFQYTLVGSFCHGRPKIFALKKAFNQIGFVGAVHLGLLDKTHILIRFEQEKDNNRCFCRDTWSILGYPVHVTKYTFDFDPMYDAPIVPVWILFLLFLFIYTNNRRYLLLHL